MDVSTSSVICRFQYSGRALALVGALALAALFLVAITPGPPVLRALAAGWIVGTALAAAFRLPGSGRRGPRALVLRAGGGIVVRSAAGEWQPGELRGDCFVAPWLVIVRWRPEGARRDRTLLVLPGMASREALRKIRVILRWR